MGLKVAVDIQPPLIYALKTYPTYAKEFFRQIRESPKGMILVDKKEYQDLVAITQRVREMGSWENREGVTNVKPNESEKKSIVVDSVNDPDWIRNAILQMEKDHFYEWMVQLLDKRNDDLLLLKKAEFDKITNRRRELLEFKAKILLPESVSSQQDVWLKFINDSRTATIKLFEASINAGKANSMPPSDPK